MAKRDAPDYSEIQPKQYEAYRHFMEKAARRLEEVRQIHKQNRAERLREQQSLKDGEDFFFEVPKHPANKMFADRLQHLGFERSPLIAHENCDRFYMPEGTDLEQVTLEYQEYFKAGEAPTPNIIPLGGLSPSASDDVPVFAERQEPSGWPPEN